MRALTVIVVLTAGSNAYAQPCEPCARGAAPIQQFDLGELAGIAHDATAVPLAEPVSKARYAEIAGLRARSPKLSRVGALDDAQLADVAAQLCVSQDATCVPPTTVWLECLADRCAIETPPERRGNNGLEDAATKKPCYPSMTPRQTTPLGLGIDVGSGVQRSQYPTEGRAWSYGIEARVRATQRWSAIARIDRIGGRDAAEDVDRNGKDDASTGSITRIAALAGPSLVFDRVRFEGTQRYLRLDVLGGYLGTRSQPGESGLAAGLDLAFHLTGFRFGVRYTQGFGDARDASIVIAHLGFVAGAGPLESDPDTCEEPPKRSSRFGIGVVLPIGGAGFNHQLGYMPTGFGARIVMRGVWRVDLVAQADMLWFLGIDHDRVIQQAVLGGVRYEHTKRRLSSRVGWSAQLLAGYSHGAAPEGSGVRSGPVVDGAVGFGLQEPDDSTQLCLHVRAGLGGQNDHYIATFLSLDADLHFDRSRWR